MLNFFRKYQRFLFTLVAIFLVFSFVFFGVNFAFDGPKKAPRHEVGRGLDGLAMWSDEIDQLARMIGTDQHDRDLIDSGEAVNFLNDGVIRKEILATGIGEALVTAYFDELSEELQERIDKHRRYVPYTHPYAPFISVEGLWRQFAPEKWSRIEAFLAQPQCKATPQVFAELAELYHIEQAVPPHLIRQYLLFQQQNYQGVPNDPGLPRENLGLFRCRSLHDWFGPRFIELTAQWIYQAACLAKMRGYRVSDAEVRLELMRRAYEMCKTEKQEATEAEAVVLYQSQLRRLQLTEKEALKSWKKVMLFRRLFEEHGRAVVCDTLASKAFYGFAAKEATIDLYRVPAALERADFENFLKLNVYLDAVSTLPKRAFFLPRTFASVDEVEKKCPKLIEQRALVEMASVSIDEVAGSAVSLKQMWDWQVEADHYAELEKEFPTLAFKKGASPEAYFDQLEKLDEPTREEVDRFSRRAMVRAHPEWVKEALERKSAQEKRVSFSPLGERASFLDRQAAGAEWARWMQCAALKKELTESETALEARDQLSCWSPDEETYYRFELIERDLTKRILTFAEANDAGVLDRLLDRLLEKKYPEHRGRQARLFQDETGGWKPVAAVKKELGALVYAERLRAIEKKAHKRGIAKPAEGEEGFEAFYCYGSLLEESERELQALKRGEERRLEVGAGAGGALPAKAPLAAQWTLRKETQVIKRCEKSPWVTAKLFDKQVGSWSSLRGGRTEPPYFFFLREIKTPSGPFDREMEGEQQLLAKEAKQMLALELLSAMQSAEPKSEQQ